MRKWIACATALAALVVPATAAAAAETFHRLEVLQTASVRGTVTSRDGRVIDVDMSWAGTGPLEVTTNTTTLPGFAGLFVARERDVVATGTVVVDGVTLVDGSTTNASIESLEDNNVSTGAAG